MKMNHRARALIMAGTLAASVGLASCGSDENATVEPAAAPEATQAPATETVVVTQAPPETEEPESAETTQEPAPETEEPAAETEEPAPEGGDLPEGATAPGTKLAFGESATVNYAYGDEGGLMKVTVTSIDKGKPEDLDALDLGDQAAGLTPYYINVDIEGVDATSEKLTYASLGGAIDGLLGDGSGAQTLSIIGNFEPCNEEDFGEFDADSKVSTCVPYLASGDAKVESAKWADYDSPYDSLDGDPIVWSK